MEFEFDGTRLKIYENGEMFRWIKGNWRLADTIDNYGYLRIKINYKNYSQHRIIGMFFLGLDIDDLSSEIDHIDRNKLNNSIDNLRIVSRQQNMFNTSSKGYRKTKYGFQGKLKINGIIYTKFYKTEAKAVDWYQKMKAAFHNIDYL